MAANPTFKDRQRWQEEVAQLERDPYDLWGMFDDELGLTEGYTQIVSPQAFLAYMKTPNALRIYVMHANADEMQLGLTGEGNRTIITQLVYKQLIKDFRMDFTNALTNYPSKFPIPARTMFHKMVGSFLISPR